MNAARRQADFLKRSQQQIAALEHAIDSCPPSQRATLARSLFSRLVWLALLGSHAPTVPLASLWSVCQGRQTLPAWLSDLLYLPDASGASIEQHAVEQAAAMVASYSWNAAGTADALGPTVIGALVEQAADRKQSGVYYTGADVTAYIAAASIVPALLEQLAMRHPAHFAPGGPAWVGLRQCPQRYIFAALRHGCGLPLPAGIAATRDDWNQSAPADYGLPGETWREHLARREYGTTLHRAMRSGAVGSPDDLVSHNLDLRQFLTDWIAACPPDILADLLELLTALRLLDPTCGAGAFLLAGAEVLATIYHSCHERAARFATDARLADWLTAYPDAATMHLAIAQHNLYGSDIVAEAVAACRMRLTLWLLQAGSNVGKLHWNQQICRADALDPAMYPFADSSFDVVIGNPPYRVRRGSQRDYPALRSAATGNLYAMVLERSLNLLRPAGRLGMVLPIASVSTDGMRALQQLYTGMPQWHSHYAVRPGKLFAGVDMNLTISLLCKRPASGMVFASGYQRWSNAVAGARAALFPTLRYTNISDFGDQPQPYPKLGSARERDILHRMLSHGRRLAAYQDRGGATMYYHSGGRYWRKALLEQLSSHYKPLQIEQRVAPIVFCLLNSQLFYWYWIAHSNCMDLVARDVLNMPVFILEHHDPAAFAGLGDELLACYQRNGSIRHRRGARINRSEINIDMVAAHPIIDRIDQLLAQAYGFDPDQLDFIRNYDIKYRVCRK